MTAKCQENTKNKTKQDRDNTEYRVRRRGNRMGYKGVGEEGVMLLGIFVLSNYRGNLL